MPRVRTPASAGHCLAAAPRPSGACIQRGICSGFSLFCGCHIPGSSSADRSADEFSDASAASSTLPMDTQAVLGVPRRELLRAPTQTCADDLSARQLACAVACCSDLCTATDILETGGELDAWSNLWFEPHGKMCGWLHCPGSLRCKPRNLCFATNPPGPRS
jgi:hypothetical protein